MNHLSSKKSSWLCICIVVFILITGMCFDQGKTDSLFSYELNMESNTVIASLNTVMWDLEICTSKMLRIKSVSGILTSIECSEKQSREESFFSFALADVFLKEPGGIFLYLGVMVLLSIEAGKRIANYVHKTDGKKRMCLVCVP